MTADDIIKLAKETREAQKSYFKTRSQGDLFGQKESGENPRPVCGSTVD